MKYKPVWDDIKLVLLVALIGVNMMRLNEGSLMVWYVVVLLCVSYGIDQFEVAW